MMRNGRTVKVVFLTKTHVNEMHESDDGEKKSEGQSRDGANNIKTFFRSKRFSLDVVHLISSSNRGIRASN